MIDVIGYAGKPKTEIKVSGVRILQDWKFWIRFSTGEARICDFKPMLEYQALKPLKDYALFKETFIDYGVLVFNNVILCFLDAQRDANYFLHDIAKMFNV